MRAQRSAKRAYGSGSIFEVDGTWYGKWRINGQQVKRRLGPKRTRGEADGLTKAQAEARLRQLIADVQIEDVQPRDAGRRRPGDLTIGELTVRYIDHAREHRGLKAGTTLTDYASIDRNHLTPFFGARPLRSIDRALVEEFARHLRTKDARGRRGGRGKKLAPKSVANYLGFLSTLLNFAVESELIVRSPMSSVRLQAHRVVEAGDAPIAELRFLEPFEVARLIDAARPGVYHVLDRALYLLAALSGLRQSELLGLRWSRVDFAAETVRVFEGVTRGTRSSPKGKRSRTVPLAGPVADALRELQATSPWIADDDPVFATPSTGNPMARTPLMKRYRQALKAAGLPESFVFHDLRHTFGTTLARAGESVTTIQAWMGHADLATTQLYMHYAPRGGDAARIAAAFGWANGNSD